MALILPNQIANGQFADGDKLDQNFDTIQGWANGEAVVRTGEVAMVAPLLLPGPPTETNQAATKGYVDAVGLIGEIKMWGGDTEPPNWMFARGQAISRATYATLFGIYGTKYGAGDGASTFNLPSLMGRMPMGLYPSGAWGATLGLQGGSKDAVVPTHDHAGPAHQHNGPTHQHTFSTDARGQHAHWPQSGPGHGYAVYQGDVYPTTFVEGAGALSWKVGGAVTGNAITDTAADHQHAGTTNWEGGGLTSWSGNGRTSTDGVSPTDKNLPPYTVINFIVKVL